MLRLKISAGLMGHLVCMQTLTLPVTLIVGDLQQNAHQGSVAGAGSHREHCMLVSACSQGHNLLSAYCLEWCPPLGSVW